MITTLALRNFVILANDLDSRSLHKEADFIDSIIFKYSQTTGFERTLDRVNEGVGTAERVVGQVTDKVDQVKDKVDQVQKTVRTAEEIARAAGKGIAFIRQILQGTKGIGDFLESTRIPGLAFIGQLLKAPYYIQSIVKNIKPIWDTIYGLIKKKVTEGSIGRVCLSAADLGAYKDQIVFLLSLLAGPFAAAINTALNIAEGLSSLGLGVGKLELCVGQDVQQEAQTVAQSAVSLGEQYEEEIYEYLAINTQSDRGNPMAEGRVAFA